jgi:hypothetical protein
MRFRFIACVSIVSLLSACGSADGESSQTVEQTQAPLLGDMVPGSGCTTAQRQYLDQWSFVARTVVASRAFAGCLKSKLSGFTSQYVRCADDPAPSGTTHEQNALRVARNVNKVGIACTHADSEFSAQANGGTFGNYDQDDLRFNKWLDDQVAAIGNLADPNDDAASRAAFPEQLEAGASLIVHEAFHQHGYSHWNDPREDSDCAPESGVTTTTCDADADCAAGERCAKAPGAATGRCAWYRSGTHSMPYIVGQCVDLIISQSHNRCDGGFCPSRTADDLQSCRDTGRLQLVNGYGSSSGDCSEHFDPASKGTAILRFANIGTTSEFRAVDYVPLGQFFGQNWRNTSSTTKTFAVGNMSSSHSGDEFVVRSSWGVGVITTQSDRLNTVTLAPWGTALSHFGDGTGTWTLDSTNYIVGAQPFTTPFGSDEIFVRGSSSVGIVAVVQGALRTRSVLSSGTQVQGPFGHWNFDMSNSTLPIRDMSGDGLAEILVSSPWGKAILSRTGANGTFTVLDIRAHGDRWGAWHVSPNDSIVAIDDFNGDGRRDLLVKSGWGLGLIGIPSGQTRLTALWLAPWGTNISGRWTLRSSDRFVGVPGGTGRLLFSSRRSVVVRGTDGLGVLTFGTGSGPAASMDAGQKVAPGAQIPGASGVGHWTYSDNDQVEEIGDFDGDAFDSFVIKSGWGIAIIGRQSDSAQLRVQTIRNYNCGDSNDIACHDQLWGSWLASENDRPLHAIRSGVGFDYLLIRND